MPFHLPTSDCGSSAWGLWFEPTKRGKCRPLIWLNTKVSCYPSSYSHCTRDSIYTLFFFLNWNNLCLRDNILISVLDPLPFYPVNHYDFCSNLRWQLQMNRRATLPYFTCSIKSYMKTLRPKWPIISVFCEYYNFLFILIHFCQVYFNVSD